MVQAQQRPAHPVMRELLGGLDLAALMKAGEQGAFGKMLANAEYWLSFDVASFEALLSKCPSPLRELGVAIALRFSDRMGGELTLSDLGEAQKVLMAEAAEPLQKGLSEGFLALRRAVEARDRIPELEAQGYKTYAQTAGMSVTALRAMGKAIIEIEGQSESGRVDVVVGQPLVVKALDERKRPIAPPEVESRLGAPLLYKDDEPTRTYVFLVPGEYLLRVPSKASGERKLTAI
jgi:hypothetical protein